MDDSGFEFRFQPVVPFRAFRQANILRVVVPFQVDGPGSEGLKSVSIFDLVILPQKWGRVGIGPVMNLAESAGDAPAKFSAGPAIGAVKAASKRFSYGVFNQNLFGDDTRHHPAPAGRGLPARARLGPERGRPSVHLRLGARWLGLDPGRLPAGRRQATRGQPFRFSVNPQWNVKDVTGATKTRIVFT